MKKDHNKKIELLLVEDDEDFGPAISQRLAKRNYEVTRAATAEEALEKTDGLKFDVIVADIRLPGMDGIEFLKKVREKNPDLPVVMLTGYGTLETAKEAVKLDAADFLLKPLESIDDLLNPLKKAVHGYRLVRENRRLVASLERKVERLKKSRKEYKLAAAKLGRQKAELEKKGDTLREVIASVEIEKKNLRDNILANMESLMQPILNELRTGATPIQNEHLELLEKNLNEIMSSFGRTLREKKRDLSARQIEICNMIANGLSSEEIADMIGIAKVSVERHRNNIRERLGIVGQPVNLRTYLREG